MTTRTRLIILGVVCLCAVFASLWWQSQVRHIGLDVYDQIHAGMREADIMPLLGTPEPAKYDVDGGPIPVALILGPWDFVRVIPSKAPVGMNKPPNKLLLRLSTPPRITPLDSIGNGRYRRK